MHDDSAHLLSNADHGGLVRAAARLLGPAEAEDAVQDAYVRALETAPAGLNAAQAWLLTVVRHLAIDRLRRRDWMREWLAAMDVQAVATGSGANGSALTPPMTALAPSAESVATLAEEVVRALRLMASHLTPMDGAIVLLHEVFDVEHAEIARAGGPSEATTRQRLRRALARLRQANAGADATGRRPVDADVDAAPDAGEDAVFRQYLECLRLRDPRSLWAMLREPPIRAMAATGATTASASGTASISAACGIAQVGGQLGLVLTLDGVTLCVMPLGTRAGQDAETAAA